MRAERCRRIVSFIFITSFAAVLTAAPPEEVKKVYHKSYPAGPGTTLSVENRYGDVNMINWDKDSVAIQVVVTIDYPPSLRGKDLVNYITIEFSHSGNTIQAVTNINEQFINKWYRHDDKKKFRIDYTIHAPSSINFHLLNKYGDVFINELQGHADLEVRYGYLKINSLLRGNRKPLNSIVLAYSKGTIEEAGWLMLQMKYSRLEITRGEALAGETKYSKLSIEKISSVVLESKYDTYRFGTLNNLVVVASYGSIKAQEIRRKLSLETRYTGVDVEHVPAGFQSIEVDNAYGGVKIGIASGASYFLKGSTSYCKLNYPSARINRIVKNNSAEVSGYIGNNRNTKSKVVVHSKYGSVSLY